MLSVKIFQRLPVAQVRTSRYRQVSSTCTKSIDERRREVAMDIYDDVPDVPTHTGQKFEIGDPRRIRFVDKKKYVNPNIAQDLIAQVPPIACKDHVVWCDGGDPHLGHPKVYINLDKPGNHQCDYCGLRFFKEDAHNH